MARRVSASLPRDFSVSVAAVSKASACSLRATILVGFLGVLPRERAAEGTEHEILLVIARRGA